MKTHSLAAWPWRAVAVVLLIGVAAACACHQSESSDPRSGSLSDTTYRNTFFGFTLQLPAGWSVASAQTEERMRAVGSSAVAGDDPLLKAAVETAQPIQLLTLTEHPVGATVAFNSSLAVVAESVAHAPGVRTGADYLFHMDALMEKSSIPYQRLGEIHDVDLDGHTFSRRDMMIMTQPNIGQTYFVAREGDFVIAFIITSHEKATMDSLIEVVKEVDFD